MHLFARMLLAAVAAASLPAPAAAAEWVHFYSRDNPAMTYYYDQSSVRSSGGKVRVWQKAVSLSRPTTTIFLVDLDCRSATYTEKETTIQGPPGTAPVRLPRSELLADQPIRPGLSAERLMKILCR